MMAETESKYNPVGLPSISVLINRDGRVCKAVLKTMDDLANMMECGALGGMVQHSITIYPKKV